MVFLWSHCSATLRYQLGMADIISHGTEFTTKMTFIVVTRMMEYAWVLGLHLYTPSPPSMVLAVIGRSQESALDLGYC